MVCVDFMYTGKFIIISWPLMCSSAVIIQFPLTLVQSWQDGNTVLELGIMGKMRRNSHITIMKLLTTTTTKCACQYSWKFFLNKSIFYNVSPLIVSYMHICSSFSMSMSSIYTNNIVSVSLNWPLFSGIAFVMRE